jgi:signal transduction histidine kinase
LAKLAKACIVGAVRVNVKLNLTVTIAAFYLVGIAAVAVLLAGRLNDILGTTSFYNAQLARVATATRALRLEPSQMPAHLTRIQELETWARENEEKVRLAAARRQLTEKHSPAAALDELECLNTYYINASESANQRLLVLHRRATIGAVVIIVESIMLFFLLVWLVRRWLLNPLLEVDEHLTNVAAGKYEPLRMKSDEPEFLILINNANDITARLKDLSERCPKAERYAVVGESCSHVALNLRNLLNSIRSLSQYEADARKTDGDADTRSAFEFIIRTANKIDTWVRDVMTTIRPMEPRLVTQAIEPVVHDALSFLDPSMTEKALRIQFEPADDLPKIPLDRSMFEQALVAVLVNAMDATADGGLIRVIAERGPADFVSVKVQDNGTGMNAETQQRAREAFFTTKQHGIGLGLTIAEKIITQHGGRIEIESQPKQGTSVTLLLPVGGEKKAS